MRLLLVQLLLLLSGLAAAQTRPPGVARWTPGLRAGTLAILYDGARPAAATGAFLGGELIYSAPKGTQLNWTLDFARVTNLQVSRQVTHTGVVANRAISYTRFVDFEGYAALRLGATLQPGFLRRGRWRLAWQSYLNVVTQTIGRDRTTALIIDYDLDLTEEDTFSEYGSTQTEDSGKLSTADFQQLVLSTGAGVRYTFPAGPQLSLGLLFDLSPRTLLSGDQDPYLNHLEFSFSYPLQRL